jgi:hypothetical protein
MITFRAHLASRPTFLGRLNYGDNISESRLQYMKEEQFWSYQDQKEDNFEA